MREGIEVMSVWCSPVCAYVGMISDCDVWCMFNRRYQAKTIELESFAHVPGPKRSPAIDYVTCCNDWRDR